MKIVYVILSLTTTVVALIHKDDSAIILAAIWLAMSYLAAIYEKLNK